nr:spaetzle-processing enzyme-like [Drosophila kikkawai]
MASNWFGIFFAACLILQLQGILVQMVYPDCGIVSPQSRVVGGQAAGLGSAPFMAYLMKNNLYHCGGSIINKRYILTAASCLNSDITVRLGEYDDRTDPDCVEKVCMPLHEDFSISRFAYHKDYNNITLENDIALIQLSKAIEFKEHIKPICLHKFPGNATRPNEYQVYGWGATRHSGKSHSLQTTILRNYPNSRCRRPFTMNINPNVICAGARNSDTCQGDSGSPLVTHGHYAGRTRYVQMGILSFGTRKCTGFVLTAAHCVGMNMTVRLGEHDNRSNPDCEGFVCMPSHQDFGIARIAYHREYNGGTKFNDIALIKLNGNIIFNVHIQPICLHLYPANARRVTEYQVFGWGLTHYAGSTAHVLQTTNLTHFPNSQCEREFDGISVSNNQFCAGSSTGTDSCGGDSGGPLVTTIETADGESRYVQLGVVSYGDSSCMGTGVYTYAPNYGQWILENIRKMRMY